MTRVAPLWDAWRRHGGSPAVSMGGLGELSDGPFFELFIDEAWVDITTDVRVGGGVTVTRGRSSESAQVQPSSVELDINNRDGKYSPRNPLSPLFGKIGRNTPIRVYKRQGDVVRFRFTGEVAEWPPRWDLSGNDAWVSVEANGILRRLEQGAKPEHSALYRSVIADPSLVAYWPCEDPEGATSFSSALGDRAMRISSGTPEIAANRLFACSQPLPVLNDAVLRGYPPEYVTTNQTQVRFLMAMPAAGDTSQTILFFYTTGTAGRFEVVYQNLGTLGEVTLQAYDDDGVFIDESGSLAASIEGQLCYFTVDLEQDGANVEAQLRIARVGVRLASFYFLSLPGRTVGRVTQVAGPISLTDTAVGHFSVHTTIGNPIPDEVNVLGAWAGETATDRIARLCAEDGMNFAPIRGDGSESLGPQRSLSTLGLIREAADADLGVLFEPRDQLGLGYRERTSLYNQTPKLSLSYEAGEIAAPLAPTDDDQNTRNDISVTREGGGSARAVLETGALSVQEPPAGVSRYDEAKTINVELDDQLGDQATWRLSLGTVDEARYPQIALQLASQPWSDPARLATALALDIGDRIVLDDLPPELPPDQVSQVLLGYGETFDEFTHSVTLNCAPESPYRVAVWDQDHYDTAGSELAADVTDSATSLSVAITSGPVWTQDVDDFPFDVMCGGERMTVTAISGASSPQTFTVTRSVNTITKSHFVGTALSLAEPVRWAL